MFTAEEVSKIARLSSLELTDEEIESYVEEFTSILNYFEVLKRAEVAKEFTEAAIELPEEGRNDERQESSFKPEHFSPYLENGFFKVPRVIDHGN